MYGNTQGELTGLYARLPIITMRPVSWPWSIWSRRGLIACPSSLRGPSTIRGRDRMTGSSFLRSWLTTGKEPLPSRWEIYPPKGTTSDVNDSVEAYMRLLEGNASSEIVNICSGKTISVANILEEMNAIAGYNIEVASDPSLFRKNDIARLVGSNRKLRALTGFAPNVPIQQTLRRMYLA